MDLATLRRFVNGSALLEEAVFSSCSASGGRRGPALAGPHRRWLQDNGCDAWVIKGIPKRRRNMLSTASPNRPRSETTLTFIPATCLLPRTKVVALHDGIIALRRAPATTGPNRKMSELPKDPFGEYVPAGVSPSGLPASTPSDDQRSGKPRLAPYCRLEQFFSGEGQWQPTS